MASSSRKKQDDEFSQQNYSQQYSGQQQYYGQQNYQQQQQRPQQIIVVMPRQQADNNAPFRSGTHDQRRSSDDYSVFSTSFDDKEIRNKFVQKVYAILAVQLLLTSGVCCIFMFVDEVLFFVKYHFYIIFICFVIYFVAYICLICCTKVRRRSPYNFICLGIYTMALSVLLGVMCAYYDVYTVLMALGTTVIICTLVTAFACQTKWDITGCGCILCIMMLAFMIFTFISSMVMIFLGYMPILHLVIAGVGTALFCVFLIYDTQLIMGGKRIELSPEEYVLGALQLYIDIVMIFHYLLVIIGFARGG